MSLITTAIEVIYRFVLLTIKLFGYGGVFLLMTLESAGLPIPSEIVMPFSGFLVSAGSFTFWAAVGVGTAGNIAGSLFLYWIGARFGRPFVARWGAYVFFRVSELERAERWFENWGGWAIFVARLLPGIRTYISFPAGLAKMALVPFTLLTAIGSFPWVLGLTWAGAVLGERWETMRHYFERFGVIMMGVLLALALVWWVWKRYANSKVKNQNAKLQSKT